MTLNSIYRVIPLVFLLFITSFTSISFAQEVLHAEEDDLKFEEIKNAVGETQADLQKQLDENRHEQERINKLLGDTRQKKVTLQNEIVYQENQIRLTTLKIEETQTEIDKLTGQINQLEGVLTDLSAVFAERAVETYKQRRMGESIVSLLTSDNVSSFVSRFQYLQRLQQNDRDLLLQMQASQTNFENQRAKIATLQAKLEAQKNQLASQKVQKQKLLDVTRNDESRYQEMLAALRADESAIQRALTSLIARIVAGIATGTPVSKGSPVGVQGNTGYVFPKPSASCPDCGTHLHYMVLPCDITKSGLSCHTNPEAYLDNGEYRQPMDLGGSWRDHMTQAYGYTSFAQGGAYGGAGHSGIDLQGYEGRPGPVYAVADGTVYYGTDSAGGKYGLIKHRDDFWTAYWHLL